MKVKFKKLHPDAVTPSYAHSTDAAMDITAVSKEYNSEYDFTEYKSGLAFELPPGHVGLLFPRSSISKKSFTLCNSVGVLDENFRGDISFRFRETNHRCETYNVGDRIGQIMIIPRPQIELEEVEELSTTERGCGAYGSTNKKDTI